MHIPAIVSLHAQFTLSYHLPHEPFQFPESSSLGSAKMLISLLTDRNEMYKTVQYIGRVHARVVKEKSCPWPGPGYKKLRRNSRTGWNFSRFLASGLSDKLHFRDRAFLALTVVDSRIRWKLLGSPAGGRSTSGLFTISNRKPHGPWE